MDLKLFRKLKEQKVDRDKLMEDIKNAVTTGRTVANLEEDGCYINPTVYADDLTKDCQQMNELTDVVVTYDFSDRKETVDRSVIKNWLQRTKMMIWCWIRRLLQIIFRSLRRSMTL